MSTFCCKNIVQRPFNNVAHLIEPQPQNWKIVRSSQTTYANISNHTRKARRLYLSGSSQYSRPVTRFNRGSTQFGNSYLGKPVSLNYLGRAEGMPGGSGTSPGNRY